jgi:hypothetical protein
MDRRDGKSDGGEVGGWGVKEGGWKKRMRREKIYSRPGSLSIVRVLICAWGGWSIPVGSGVGGWRVVHASRYSTCTGRYGVGTYLP